MSIWQISRPLGFISAILLIFFCTRSFAEIVDISLEIDLGSNISGGKIEVFTLFFKDGEYRGREEESFAVKVNQSVFTAKISTGYQHTTDFAFIVWAAFYPHEQESASLFTAPEFRNKEDLDGLQNIDLTAPSLRLVDRRRAVEGGFPIVPSGHLKWGKAPVAFYIEALKSYRDTGFLFDFDTRKVVYEFLLTRARLNSLNEEDRTALVEFLVAADFATERGSGWAADELEFKLDLFEKFLVDWGSSSLTENRTVGKTATEAIMEIYDLHRLRLIERWAETLEKLKGNPQACIEVSDMMLRSLVSPGSATVSVSIKSTVRRQAILNGLKIFIDCIEIRFSSSSSPENILEDGFNRFFSVDGGAEILERFATIARELIPQLSRAELKGAKGLQVTRYYKLYRSATEMTTEMTAMEKTRNE